MILEANEKSGSQEARNPGVFTSNRSWFHGFQILCLCLSR
jgi:hypothetical protein